jgi:hypothetical protein
MVMALIKVNELPGYSCKVQFYFCRCANHDQS